MKRIIITSIKLIFISAFCFSLYAQSPDRSKPPQLSAPQKLHLPAIQQFMLSNGLKVVLMEKHEVPLVQLNVIIKAGSINDPENKTGLAGLTMSLLMEGAAGKSSLEIADAIDFLGARITATAGAHSSGVYLHTPLSKLDDALKIMSDILLRPDFPQKELDRKKKDRLTSLMQMHDQPGAIVTAAFNKTLFGKDDPYGRIISENEINGFSVNDMKNFHKKYSTANNSFIIVVGDIKKDDLKKKLETAFGKWKSGEVKEIKIKEPSQVTDRTVYLIDKPGSAQSVIIIGRIGTSRLTPDYNQIVVMNTLLGGSFTSRLNQNLREKHGYTYGASSGFTFRPTPGSFYATSSVQTEVTDKALTEFFNELNGIREPLTEDDLNRAKNLVALSYPSNFQSASEIARQLEEMVFYNLPSSYFSEFVSKILNVNGNDVNIVAKKYIVPDKMIIVVVGDKSKIEEGINKLNLGKIINLSIEDVLGKVPKLD